MDHNSLVSMDLVPTKGTDLLELYRYYWKSEGLNKELSPHNCEFPYVPHLSECSAATGSDSERVPDQESQSERQMV
jgi:hypothetical protein